MASKENQGLQASVIVLGILSIGLFVGVILLNNAKKTQSARADSAEAASSTAQADASKAQAEASTYKEWIGFAEGDNITSLTELFKTDSERYGKAMEETSRKYRTMLDNIYEENRKLGQNEDKAKQDLKTLNDQLLALEAQKAAEVGEAQKQAKAAADDLAKEKEKFAAFRKQIQDEKDSIQANFTKLQGEHDKSVADHNAEKSTLNNAIATLERSIDKLKAGLPNPDEFAQPADGRIFLVSQEHGKVWINLGSGDGLRPQVTFKVVDVTDSDAEETKEKANIEIVRILGDHMAEARITSDDPKNPVMVGDRVYSLVWDRGRQVGFSIAGFIDVDKDRVSDLELLKSVIAASNGRVDAAPDESGAKQGETKVDTRYLILGEFPEEARQGKLRESWESIGDEAEALGVQAIALDEFLKLMGWQPNSRSVAMDATSRAEDFPVEARGQELPRKTRQPAGVFKKRLPGAGY